MSIIKSNSASALDEPFTYRWFVNKGAGELIIPGNIVYHNSRAYCELSKFHAKSYRGPYSIRNTSVCEMSESNGSCVIRTKAIYYYNGHHTSVLPQKILRTKRDIIEFLDEINDILKIVQSV